MIRVRSWPLLHCPDPGHAWQPRASSWPVLRRRSPDEHWQLFGYGYLPGAMPSAQAVAQAMQAFEQADLQMVAEATALFLQSADESLTDTPDAPAQPRSQPAVHLPKVWTADKQHTYHVQPDCSELPTGEPKKRELCVICSQRYIPGMEIPKVYTTANGDEFHIDQLCMWFGSANALKPMEQCLLCTGADLISASSVMAQ